MTRKKVKLAFIVNDSARKATYKKRKKGLLKKVDELSTLCGIDACAILYSSFDPEPVVWPSTRGVRKVLEKFRTMPELEQSKKMINQESFLNQRIQKGSEQVKKCMNENREKETALLMFESLGSGNVPYNNINVYDLNDLTWMLEQSMRDISKRLEEMDLHANEPHQPRQMVTPTFAVAKNEEMTMIDHGHDGFNTNNIYLMQRQQLFMDLLNGDINNNGDEIPMPLPPKLPPPMPSFFGDFNYQPGFWPNQFP
ncbi:hypothetical protein RJT34_12992 [Clitoria ternatea]|uniref:MADS-box domain-containing protein n=1 Tax=Clitoria ternatea TaxID=43366 RepID=A0AAN9JN41_CLITE